MLPVLLLGRSGNNCNQRHSKATEVFLLEYALAALADVLSVGILVTTATRSYGAALMKAVSMSPVSTGARILLSSSVSMSNIEFSKFEVRIHLDVLELFFLSSFSVEVLPLASSRRLDDAAATSIASCLAPSFRRAPTPDSDLFLHDVWSPSSLLPFYPRFSSCSKIASLDLINEVSGSTFFILNCGYDLFNITPKASNENIRNLENLPTFLKFRIDTF